MRRAAVVRPSATHQRFPTEKAQETNPIQAQLTSHFLLLHLLLCLTDSAASLSWLRFQTHVQISNVFPPFIFLFFRQQKKGQISAVKSRAQHLQNVSNWTLILAGVIYQINIWYIRDDLQFSHFSFGEREKAEINPKI